MAREDSTLKLLLPEIFMNPLLANGKEECECNDTLNFLRQKRACTEEDKIGLLQRIAYCLMTLHKNGIPHDRRALSQTFIMKNFFKTPTLDKTSEEEKNADMRSLANEYCCILTNGHISEYSERYESHLISSLSCSYPYEALDIIKKMFNGEITMEEVLQHPFHWSDQQKVLFLCRTVDYINAKYEEAHKKIEKEKILHCDDNCYQAEDVFGQGWMEQLILTKDEVKKKNLHNNGVKVDQGLIYELALRMDGVKEKREKLVYELLRFFRNRYIHCYEDPKNVRICFGSYPTGYLKFFSSRFPKLFMHVYNNMKMHLCMEDEFENERFNQALFNVNVYVQ